MKLIGISGKSRSGKDTLARMFRFFPQGDGAAVEMAFADPIKRILKNLYGWSDETLWGPSHLRDKPDFGHVRMVKHHAWFCEKCIRLHAISDDDLRAKLGSQPQSHKRCHACKSFSPEHIFRLTAMTVYLTPRFALTSLGTEWGQDMMGDRLIWVNRVLADVRELARGNYVYDRTRGGVEFANGCRPLATALITDVRFIHEFDRMKAEGALMVRIRRPDSSSSTHRSETELDSVPDDRFDAVIENDGSLDELRLKAATVWERLLKVHE